MAEVKHTGPELKFIEQNKRWGHLSIAQNYQLLDDLVAAVKFCMSRIELLPLPKTPNEVKALNMARAVLTKVKP